MSSCLIVCRGFFGDHFFASSVAEKLVAEGQGDNVDYLVGFPQVKSLLERNPHIRSVKFMEMGPLPIAGYDMMSRYGQVFHLPTLDFTEKPAVAFQKSCGIHNITPGFTIYTDPAIDDHVKVHFDKIRDQTDAPILAIMNNWQCKSYLFTKEEYARGIDVPNLGYGGKLRNTDWITEQLGEQYPVVLVGANQNHSQFNTSGPYRSIEEECSMIKHCDYFIGAEGGLANMAGGVGTKAIVTSEFVAQLYGPNGCIRKIPEPQLGPHLFFPEAGHSFLSPYGTDAELLERIIGVIESKTPEVFNWKDI